MNQLGTGAVIEDGQGQACFFHDEDGDQAYWLPRRDEVLQMPCRVYDAWSSQNGSAYLAVEARWPIVQVTDGNMAFLPLTQPSRKQRIGGRSGASADEDELFLVAGDRLCWRVGGRWCSHDVGEGEFVALTVSAKDVFCAVGPRGGAGRLFRLAGNAVTKIAPPPSEKNATAVGLALGDDGALLALYGGVWDDPVRPWLRRASGEWTRVRTDRPIKPWLAQVRCRTWNGVSYLPAENGIFVWDGGTRIRRENPFRAISLWPWGKRLVCRGWKDGSAFHLVKEDGAWKPLTVLEPDVVFGGHGKVVWLGKGRKLPVRKIRLPAPQTRPARRAKPKALPAFSLAQHLAGLAERDGASKRAKPIDAAGRVEGALATAMAPDLKALFKLHGKHELSLQAGLWNVWDPPVANDAPLKEWVEANYVEPHDLIALFSDTVALGADGGGQVYFAEVAPRRSEIYIHDPGTSGLGLLADSFTSFARLNAREELWQAACERTGIDMDDLFDGEVPKHELAPFRAEALALKGKLNLCERSDFDETWEALAGRSLRTKPRAEVLARHRQNQQLMLSLYLDDPQHLGKNGKLGPIQANEPPSAKLRRLWMAYFFDRRDDLEQLFSAYRKDRAQRVVRTVELLRVLTDGARKLPAPLERFRQLKKRVR